MERIDQDIIVNIVKDMANAQTGEEITQSWHENAVWYDLQFLQEKGLENCLEVFKKQFSLIQNIRTEILDIKAFVAGTVGFVHSVQHFECDDLEGNPASDIITRQTDCFVKEGATWKLIHQHVSLPSDFSTGKTIFKSGITRER